MDMGEGKGLEGRWVLRISDLNLKDLKSFSFSLFLIYSGKCLPPITYFPEIALFSFLQSTIPLFFSLPTWSWPAIVGRDFYSAVERVRKNNLQFKSKCKTHLHQGWRTLCSFKSEANKNFTYNAFIPTST